MNNILLLSRRFGISKSNLVNALTHYSFYEEKNETNGNSRYVFAGMYAFKGEVAKRLAMYHPGSGTQLQHYLGNIFSNERLNNLFDELGLLKEVRASKSFDIKKHKHIFVYGLAGCIFLETNNPDILTRFISRYFLLNTENLFPGNKNNNRNHHGQADMLSKQLFNSPLLINVINKNSLFNAEVYIKDRELLAKAESKSYRYVRKKAMKLALKKLSEILAAEMENKPTYTERLEQRQKKLKEEKALADVQKQKEKKAKQKESSKRYKELLKQREEIRNRAKALAKARKKAKEEYQAKIEKAGKKISSNKRRFLEDKKK